MEKGAYIVHQHPTNDRDIEFSVKPSFKDNVPDIQQKLHFEVEKALSVLRMIFEDEEGFRPYFIQLLSLAQAGLVGDNAQPTISLKALEQFKNEIVNQKSGEVKNKYFKSLGLMAIKVGSFPLILGLTIIILHYFYPCSPELTRLKVFSNFLFIWSSCMLGVWLSFGARKTILKFEDLNMLEADRLEPLMRLLFAGFIALVFSLLFYSGAMTIELGDISTGDISENAIVAIIFGTFLGVSEQVLGKKITKQAASIFNKQ